MPSPLVKALPEEPLVHLAWDGWWIVARRRGDLYVAPVPPVHRAHHGDFILGDLRTVAACAHGAPTRGAAQVKANDLYPYAAFRKAA